MSATPFAAVSLFVKLRRWFCLFASTPAEILMGSSFRVPENVVFLFVIENHGDIESHPQTVQYPPPSCLPTIQGTLDTERKFAAGENKSSHRGHMNMKKLDDETEEFQREFLLLSWIHLPALVQAAVTVASILICRGYMCDGCVCFVCVCVRACVGFVARITA